MYTRELFQHLSALCIEACKCAGVFARDSLLQSSLVESGVLWHLLLFLFNYDYTLDEATGINADAATHETVRRAVPCWFKGC